MKTAILLRLNAHQTKLLDLIGAKTGLGRTDALRLAISRLAEMEGIQVKPKAK